MAQSPKSAKNGDMRIDPALVRELAQLLTDTELTEIEIQDGDRRIKVKREAPPIVAAAGMGSAFAAPVAPALTGPPVHAKEDLQASGAAEEEAGGNAVKSPMVGTAFLSPEPGSKPFVSVGDTVKAGATLCIIEAMKVMNPITSPEAGTIKKIMVADAQPVEFDQPLVIIG